MPINAGILNRRGRERRGRPRPAPLVRARARRNFRENYNANSSTLHGYTRNVHRVHSPARRAVTLDQSRRVQLRTFDPPSPRSSGHLCHRVGALQSRYLHITGLSLSLSLSLSLCPSRYLSLLLPLSLSPSARSTLVSFSLSLRRSAQREERRSSGIPSDKNFNMARREPYRATASTCVIFEFYRMKSRNCAARNTPEIQPAQVMHHRSAIVPGGQS